MIRGSESRNKIRDGNMVKPYVVENNGGSAATLLRLITTRQKVQRLSLGEGVEPQADGGRKILI